MKKLLGILLLGTVSCVQAEVVDIDINGLQQMMKDKVVVIDVRTPGEWEKTGIVDESIPIMFFDEKRKPFPKAWMKEAFKHISPDEKVVLICRSGRRSKTVGNFLVNLHGYKQVYNVQGGILAWIKAGNKTVGLAGEYQ